MSAEQQHLQDLLNEAYTYESTNNTEKEQYLTIIKEISDKDPMNYIYVEKYALSLAGSGKLDLAQECFEKALRYNSAQVELWKRFVNFAIQYHYLLNQDEEKCKQILERAMDNVGQHMKASEIWAQFIDFEISLSNMGFVNLLGYLSIKTPLLDTEKMVQKYLEILDTLYDAIVDDMHKEGFTVGDKYKAKYEELVKLMMEDCQGDKFEFIKKVQEQAQETKKRVEQRLQFENKIMRMWEEGRTREEEKESWLEYINFEISQGMHKRAKLLYERALISLDKDKHFWISYIQFIEKNLKDPQLVRAKFENRLKHCDKFETIDIMIENALFEEEQQQIQKARKIYESLQNEIAPDYIKSLVAYINFEKRQNNVEKVKELYFKAYSTSMQKNQIETVSYIVIQYARFLAFKCNDTTRAIEILNQAIQKAKGCKTLYLSYVNFLKHQEGSIQDVYAKIVQVFEKGIDESTSGINLDDRIEIARFYIEYMQENCQNVGVLRSTEQSLKDKGLLHVTRKKQFTNIGAKISNEIQNFQENGNGHGEDGKIDLGKRSSPENGFEESQKDDGKRVKLN